MKQRRRLLAWCNDCGRSVNRGERCRDHWDGGTTTDNTHSRRVAWDYLWRQAEEGIDLERWVSTADTEVYWPGTSRGDLALMLSLMTRWEKLPSPRPRGSAIGLFGPRPEF